MNSLDHLFIILLTTAIVGSSHNERKGALGLMITVWAVEVVYYAATEYLF